LAPNPTHYLPPVITGNQTNFIRLHRFPNLLPSILNRFPGIREMGESINDNPGSSFNPRLIIRV
jgi:hypothetical protein